MGPLAGRAAVVGGVAAGAGAWRAAAGAETVCTDGGEVGDGGEEEEWRGGGEDGGTRPECGCGDEGTAFAGGMTNLDGLGRC